MTPREIWLATMRYQPRDRAPRCDFGFWPETLSEWHAQGLPAEIDSDHKASRYFGMDVWDQYAAVHVGLRPWFEPKVLEDRGDHEIAQQHDGVRVLRKKWMGSIPQHESHLLVDRASWLEHYLPRLDPNSLGRTPAEAPPSWSDADRDEPLMLHVGSLYGWLRDWMGVEAISYVVYDDPAWFEEMVETLASCIEETLRRAFALGGVFDGAGFWEDMCFATGPLLAPSVFERVLVPRYRRITDLLRANGVEHIWVDCDGKIDALIPLWLDAGVQTMFPIEVGTWQADPVAMRREYGRELRLMGGFDKRILVDGPGAIDREVDRLTPLIEEGGFIPFCDHRVPPNVPLDHYRHYLRAARQAWG